MPAVTPMPTSNWAGNVRFAPAAWEEPGSVEELQSVVARARRVRTAGRGHSFSALACSDGVMVSLRRLPVDVDIDAANRQAWFSAGATYAEVAPVLDQAGWALANLASLTEITLGGACATATHGSGRTNGCLAAQVTGVEMVAADGELIMVTREADDLFPGAVVALGALGVVTRLRLDLVPRFDLAQEVWLDLPLTGVLERLDDLLTDGYSVSLFTDWRRADILGQVWVKRLVGTDPSPSVVSELGGRRALVAVHPIAGADASLTTPQLARPGSWHERLPHFRSGALPSGGGAELQSEWLVDRVDGREALGRLARSAAVLAPALLVSEVRAVAADDLWLSPAAGRESVALHFTWRPNLLLVEPAIRRVEESLGPLGARPHWAKLSGRPPADVPASFPQAGDFARLRRSMDPEGRFLNRLLSAFFPPDEAG